MQKEPAIVEPDDTKPRLILQSKTGELTYIEDGDPLAEILSNQQYPSLRNFSFKFESPEAQIQIPQTIPVSCNDMSYPHGAAPPQETNYTTHFSASRPSKNTRTLIDSLPGLMKSATMSASI